MNFSADALSDIVVDCVEQVRVIRALNETGMLNDTENNTTDIGINIPENLDLDDIENTATVVECGTHGKALQGL